MIDKVKDAFAKILVNVISVIVIGIVVGAVKIVWDGATSVEPRIKAVETKVLASVEVLADRYAYISLQLDSIKAISKQKTQTFESFDRNDNDVIKDPIQNKEGRKNTLLEEIDTRQQKILK